MPGTPLCQIRRLSDNGNDIDSSETNGNIQQEPTVEDRRPLLQEAELNAPM